MSVSANTFQYVQPHFLREGGVLGFACQHSYVFKEFGQAELIKKMMTMMEEVGRVLQVRLYPQDPKILLKGSDRMVMLAAISLGLEVTVGSIVNTDNDYSYRDSSLFHYGFFYEATDALIGEGDSWKQYFEDNGYESAENIIWCQKLKEKVPAITALTYGNQNSAETCYMAAAILVNVPKIIERKVTSTR